MHHCLGKCWMEISLYLHAEHNKKSAFLWLYIYVSHLLTVNVMTQADGALRSAHGYRCWMYGKHRNSGMDFFWLHWFCSASPQTTLLSTHISLCLRLCHGPIQPLLSSQNRVFPSKVGISYWVACSHGDLPPLLIIWLFLSCMAYLCTLKMNTVESSEMLVPDL